MSEPLRVLIVEDEALLLMQLEMILEDAGHIVVGTAMSASEAIKVAEKTRPDLAFVDVHLLDGPTGLTVAQHLRSVDDTLVVFLTANAKRIPDDYAGAAGVIAKPYSQAGITAAIAFIHECIRQPPPTTDLPLGFTLGPSYRRFLPTA